LGRETAEVKWIAPGIQRNAVYRNLLADIAADDVRIITALFQVIIEPLRRSVRQIEGLGDIGLNDPLIRIKRKKGQVKGSNMVAGLDRNIVLAVAGKGFECLTAGQDINFPLGRCYISMGFVGDIATEGKRAQDDQDTEETNLLEGGFNIFRFHKHVSYIFLAHNIVLHL
jgi:hypothetical protein